MNNMMTKAFCAASMLAVASAIKLETETELELTAEKFYNFDDESMYQSNLNSYNQIKASGQKWTDPDFPPDYSSLGSGKMGDTANTKDGSNGAGVTWKRLSDIYPADKLKVFANKEAFSSAKQGALGNCYLIATMVGFDSRPGAMESLFESTAIQSTGAYAIKFYVNGEAKWVTVDDYVPCTKNRQGKYSPKFARSRIDGEIWPMLVEKAYSKIIGNYAVTRGGWQD